MRYLAIVICLLSSFAGACGKQSIKSNIVGSWEWTAQYTDNPAYDSSPQSTGIQETLSFDHSGRYYRSQNGNVIDSGTYRTNVSVSTRGKWISGVLYTNNRITDSVSYFVLTNNNDSLFFEYDLIGTVGSGSRHYGRK